MKKTLIASALLLASTHAYSETIKFKCSWDDDALIEIAVNPSNMTATRDDGGSDYRVIKLTKYAVWLEVVQLNNVTGIAIQMIQRKEAVNNQAGKWVDTVYSMTGVISSIDGGLCWEQ